MKKISDVEEGYRKANLAALYAHLRTLLARTVDPDNPVVGFHGIAFSEDLRYYVVSAGSTPELPAMLSALSFLEGLQIKTHIARQLGDHKTAMSGDAFDPATNTVHCVGCEDGDPTGEHAKAELAANAKAWLGLTLLVGQSFYGEHLPAEALAILASLEPFALPAGADVS